MSILAAVAPVVVLAGEGPAPEDVKAGWLGFAVWLGLAVAVVLLAFSFVKQLKKVDFEEEPDAPEEPGAPDDPAREEPAEGRRDERRDGPATPS